jgi:putative membrane protein
LDVVSNSAAKFNPVNPMKSKFLIVPITAALVAITGSLGSIAVAADKLSRADASFLEKVAQSDMLEISIGKLAETKGSTPEVKKLGSMLVKDHTATSAKVSEFATKYGVKLPDELDEKGKETLDALGGAEGEKFDKKFHKAAIATHKSAIAEFEKASRGADEPAIKEFATKTLPKLKDHLEMASTEHKGMHGGKAGSDASASPKEKTDKAEKLNQAEKKPSPGM